MSIHMLFRTSSIYFYEDVNLYILGLAVYVYVCFTVRMYFLLIYVYNLTYLRQNYTEKQDKQVLLTYKNEK